MVRGRQAKFAGIERCRKSRFVFDFLRRRFDCLAAEITVMFQHAPKPASNSPPVREPTQRTAAAVQAKPARAQGSAGRPQAGFGDIAIHPPRASRSGLPDRLKSGIEALSGISMDGVRVNRNSARPGKLDALAFAQGRDIHLAPGQDHHLPHEAWHLVQQAQGRVRPTLQAKTGEKVNDDGALEREADTMGAKALSHRAAVAPATLAAGPAPPRQAGTAQDVAQPMRPASGYGSKWLKNAFSSGSRPFSSGSGGGGGKEPWRPTSLDEERKKRAEAQARQQREESKKQLADAAKRQQSMEKLIKRKELTTFGSEVGFLKSSTKNSSRATTNNEGVLRSLDDKGFTSPATRANLPVDDSPPTDREITAYSGVVGEKATYSASRLIGLNKRTRHTLDVASGTAGHKSLQQFLESRAQSDDGQAMRLDDVDTSDLDMHSVSGAFKRTGQPNKWPIEGEEVSAKTIPPSALRHTAIIPLSHPMQQLGLGQPGQVHPDYLRRLGLLSEATLDDPQTYKIQTTTRRNKAYPGGSYQIDRFIPQQPKPTGREVQMARQKQRMLKKLADIRKRDEEARKTNQ